MSLTVASSSADPASSFLNLWALLKPALDYVMTSEDPKLDYNLYSTIHTSLYNYFKKQEEVDCIRKKGDLPGYELYAKLDEYFQHLCQGILLASPEHESELVTYVVSTFQRYTERAFIVQRMTSYVNQHYVRRAFNEELGWLNVEDALIAYANHTGNNLAGGSDQRTIAQIKGDFVVSELKKWGYKDGDSKANAAAEARAEAASPLDRIVPISSLAHRRFRTEFLEACSLSQSAERTSSTGGSESPRFQSNSWFATDPDRA